MAPRRNPWGLQKKLAKATMICKYRDVHMSKNLNFMMIVNIAVLGCCVGLIFFGFYLTKGKDWCSMKLQYMKRKFWNGFGRCHKCKSPLVYTGGKSSRGVCTNGYCK